MFHSFFVLLRVPSWRNLFRSNYLTPAINRYGGAANCARSFRGEKQNDIGDGFWRYPFAEVRLGHRGAILRRIDNPRHETVGVDFEFFQVGVYAFRDTNDGGLGCAVPGIARIRA